VVVGSEVVGEEVVVGVDDARLWWVWWWRRIGVFVVGRVVVGYFLKLKK